MVEGHLNTTIRTGKVTDKAAPKPVERHIDRKRLEEGDSVSPSDLPGGQKEYDQLIADGVIVEDRKDLLTRPSTKSADVHKAAVDASPADQDDGGANERADAQAKAELEARRAVELDEETRLHIASLPASEQRRAEAQAKRKAEEEAVAKLSGESGDTSGSKYESWSVEDLEAEASDRNIEGRSSMNKAELVTALEENDREGQ